jgi:hypothetical protein
LPGSAVILLPKLGLLPLLPCFLPLLEFASSIETETHPTQRPVLTILVEYVKIIKKGVGSSAGQPVNE